MKNKKNIQIKEFELLIESLPKKKNFIVHEFLFKPFFKRSIYFQTKNVNYNEEVTFKNIKVNYVFLTVLFVICSMIIFYSGKHNDVFYYTIGGLICILSFFIYLKCKKNKIIKINKDGFFIDNEIFNWQEVYDYGLFVNFGAKQKSQYIYIFSFVKGFKKYNISGFYQNEIMEALNFYRNKFNEN